MTSSSAGHDGLRDHNHDAGPDAQIAAAAATMSAREAAEAAASRRGSAAQQLLPPDGPAAASMEAEAVQTPAQEPERESEREPEREPEKEGPPMPEAAASTGEQTASADAQSGPRGGDGPASAAAGAGSLPTTAAAPPTSSPSSSSAPAQQQRPASAPSADSTTNRLSTPPPPPPEFDGGAKTDNASHEPPVTPTANASGGPGEFKDRIASQVGKGEDVTMLDAPDVGAATAAAAAETQTTHVSSTEQFQPSTPYTPQAATIDHRHAYMMMALASMSAAPPAMSPPPTVTPSQVTLPNLVGQGCFGLGSANNNLRQAGPDMGLESFARIEFADSVFQMTTYAVIIGRDQRALEQARRDEKRADEYKRRVEENASRGLPPPSPIAHDRHKFSKSYVSEEGGMLGPESDSEGNGRPAKRRKTSTTASSRNENENENSQDNIISNRQYVSHTPGAAAVDLASLRPSPWHVPFIGIHSPGPNIASKTKAISREHLKVSYNQDEGVFEAIPLHKNGFFCEDVHYKSDKVVLKCGDRLQIKDVDFRFIINGVERGRTGAEEYQEEDAAKKRHAHGGKSMSFDFEQSHGNGQIQDTSDELSDVDVSPVELSDFGGDDEEDGDEEEGAEGEEEGEDDDDDDDDDEEDDDEEDDEEEEGEEGEGDADVPEASVEGDSEIKDEGEANNDPSMPQMPRKRGPGRPPKNGIMSKREQRLLKKQQQEMAKKTIPQPPPVEPPTKRKVGRPRKNPLPGDGADRPEKRKYKPRKPKNEDGAEGSDAERRAREKKEKKARPKSPPLELKIEDYTEEQLQKPNKNYGVLIDETLTAAGPDGLTLKQIYKRICQRYPWFYFHTETKGWESSVRHNLIGNEAFKKDETTNLWSRVPGVELDAGKKRKATSPDRGLAAAQAYGHHYSYPYAAQHMARGAHLGYPPGQAPAPAYQAPAYAAHPGHVARPVQYGASQSPPGHQPVQPAVGAPPPAPIQLPGYGPPAAPARPQLGVPRPGAYSSPYASRPPPLANPSVKAEDGGAGAPPVAVAPGQQPRPATVSATAPESKAAVPGAASAPQRTTAQTASHPPQARPSAGPARPIIEPRLLTAVVGLKNGLVENLKKAGNPKAEAIVMSALNRCIGLKKEATENDKMEAICIKGIRQVIDGFTKGKSPTPSNSTALPADTPPVFEPKVLAALNGLKDASVNAIKSGLGEAKAEAVTLSAIDRVIGLADASIMPKAAEGEPVSNFEGVEQHLMKSIRQLLQGMNQKLHGDS
ncbi:forkhead domain-containing [Trichoderma cornu-damae]|uniref:Forkhead domain-containing n=1 Tax=Trichoderma cornu-damae TaxID=654480 RepID=A0A9P8QFD9_9HYPO|nr:forkhead domain-containing [Trichoderma cornu-damae]